MATPGGVQFTPGGTKLSAEQMQMMRLEREMAYRNRPLTDQDLDAMLPPKGYKILDVNTHTLYVYISVLLTQQ